MRAALLLLLTGALSCAGQELLICGWDQVSIIRIEKEREVATEFLWKAEDSPEMPPRYRAAFRTTDECKPLPGGRILVTASSDGVAILDRQSGKALFWALAPNAHSAEMLPGNRVVVASSDHKEGNRLIVFDAATPEKELSSTALISAHGVVWDEQRKRLWALGRTVLRAYRWEDPNLVQDAEYPLPSEGGHDLYALDRSAQLGLSTEQKVWLFDRDKKKFSPHWDIAWEPNVKSISVHPKTGQAVYVQAELPNWWTPKLRFMRPLLVLERKERMYKARWVR